MECQNQEILKAETFLRLVGLNSEIISDTLILSRSTFQAIVISPLQLSPLSSQLIVMLPWFISIISMQTLEQFSPSYHKFQDRTMGAKSCYFIADWPRLYGLRIFSANMICNILQNVLLCYLGLKHVKTLLSKEFRFYFAVMSRWHDVILSSYIWHMVEYI